MGGERYHHRKSRSHRVEEVTFDKEKRIDFLTGFHKRKLERRKHAQENQEKQRKEDRIEERARIREERRQKVLDRLAELKEVESKLGGGGDDDDDEEEEEEEEKEEEEKEEEPNVKRVKVEEWHGFDDDNEKKITKEETIEVSELNKKGILKVKQVYKVEDEDAPVMGTSEVTIESMDNPNQIDVSDIARMNNVDLSKSGEVLEKSINRAKDYARLMGMDDELKPSKVKKNKKPKERKYLSKRERKLRKFKEKKQTSHKRDR
ncbi:hypothetical protein FOA43_001821 [Brettanomyces nanus]|uniref:Ribosomal RNA-processing protein 17 n=1 Tax=Eeniella nana TaxID=13502 RepID=A0A875RYA5_EENNA|nr:uncharacterized protein FOA43_001821 [Brettanomyces nanus]QPG74491.1 hypothetical protein FOA43_001821 [Brettanomyces nanus]